MFDVDPVDLAARELLRSRLPALVAEACAWAVGLSDRPWVHRVDGRLLEGEPMGARAAADLPLGDDARGRFELSDARAGSFQDVLNALTPDGRIYADLLDEQVLVPFVLDTCVQAADRVRKTDPVAWGELLDDLGDLAHDLPALVRLADWEAPLRIDAEQLLLGALARVPLLEVEAEGLPLSLVRAAESLIAPPPPVPEPDDDELAGALFLAEAVVRDSGLPVPVPPSEADRLLEVLTAEPLEPEELLAVLHHLPLHQDTVDAVAERLRRLSS